MTYSTFTRELSLHFPGREEFFRLKHLDHEDGPYIWFGMGLLPMLESALKAGDATAIRDILSFVEQMSVASDHDPGLAALVGIEFGEWLNEGTWESTLESLIGPATRQVINYVPGLGTQRKVIRDEKRSRSLSMRISSWFRRSKEENKTC